MLPTAWKHAELSACLCAATNDLDQGHKPKRVGYLIKLFPVTLGVAGVFTSSDCLRPAHEKMATCMHCKQKTRALFNTQKWDYVVSSVNWNIHLTDGQDVPWPHSRKRCIGASVKKKHFTLMLSWSYLLAGFRLLNANFAGKYLIVLPLVKINTEQHIL